MNEKSEEIKKGDIESKLKENDIELVLDPDDEKNKKRKNYGTKLVDSGLCGALQV